GDGMFVDNAAAGVKEKRFRRDVRVRFVQTHVALALLLGIIERVRVKEGPHELAADIFQAELEMSVLIHGVMAAEEGGRADVDPLLVGDFFRPDQPRSVTGARGGNGGIKGMMESVAERDPRRTGLHQFARTRVGEHAGLSGHDGSLLYTRA